MTMKNLTDTILEVTTVEIYLPRSCSPHTVTFQDEKAIKVMCAGRTTWKRGCPMSIKAACAIRAALKKMGKLT